MEKQKVLDYENIKGNREKYNFGKSIGDIKNNILDSFEYVKAYHATKIYPFDDFSMGLLPASDRLIKERAKNIIIPKLPNYKESIEKIIDGIKLRIQPYIYYSLFRSNFDTSCQYHRYGSESFNLIANEIYKEFHDVRCKDLFVSSGIPTTIHFLIFVSDLSGFELKDIAELIHSDTNDWGSKTSKPIPRKQILKFEEIPKPYNKWNLNEI